MSPQAVALLVSLIGADHVMLGSDYPFSVGAPALMQALTEAGIDAVAVDAIAHTTASNLFNMETAVR